MKHLVIVLIAILIAGTDCLTGQTPTAPDEELLLFVQRDIRPSVDRLNFHEGLRHFLAGLPAATPVKIYLTANEQYSLVAEGPAGQLDWPGAVEFTLGFPSTTPYKNLLKFLQTSQVRDRTIIFVSTGVSQDMYQLIDSTGFLPGETTFAPSTYYPLPRIIDYCKKNGVRLLGLFNPPPPSNQPSTASQATLQPSQLTLSAFRYVVEDSGGKAYYNFISYQALFENILRTGAWKRKAS